ncbi:MAG: undecaprenyl-phosphate glucose phosphotransferase [Proteobacteria bacterium]|nr:undecaprenyl-phosphate glucose phosphotransferase [Pseudomonadota bacterium]
MKYRTSVSTDLARVVDLEALAQATPAEAREKIIHQLPDEPFVAPQVAAALIRMTETVLVAAVALAQLSFYPGVSQMEPLWFYAAIIGGVAIAYPVVLRVLGFYHLSQLLNPLRALPAIVLVWAGLLALTAFGILISKTGHNLSRGWFFAWSLSGLGWAIAVRFGIAAVVRRLNTRGQFNRRAILVGGGEAAAHVIATLKNSHDTGISLLGIFDDRSDERTPRETSGLHKLGTTADLISFVRRTRIDTLIVTLPVSAEARLVEIVNKLWVLPVDIRLSAQGQRLHYRPRAYSYIGNLALLDLFDRPLGDWGPLIKSVEDKIIASLALVLLSPVLAAVALAVKLDSKGPVFFRQKRYGFNNELIEVFKFRSMYHNQADADARRLVTKGDPRVTRVGAFIRKTSLDELPQLINVLRGELSLVGPRPHATKASAAGSLYENVVDSYFARHKVKPGITGWAQINGWRGETDTAEKIERRVEHDLYYIDNWSLSFDLYILARTPFALLKGENAY